MYMYISNVFLFLVVVYWWQPPPPLLYFKLYLYSCSLTRICLGPQQGFDIIGRYISNVLTTFVVNKHVDTPRWKIIRSFTENWYDPVFGVWLCVQQTPKRSVQWNNSSPLSGTKRTFLEIWSWHTSQVVLYSVIISCEWTITISRDG